MGRDGLGEKRMGLWEDDTGTTKINSIHIGEKIQARQELTLLYYRQKVRVISVHSCYAFITEGSVLPSTEAQSIYLCIWIPYCIILLLIIYTCKWHSLWWSKIKPKTSRKTILLGEDAALGRDPCGSPHLL